MKIQVGSIHYAKIQKSPRLRRLLEFMIECGSQGATTKEIDRKAEIMAVGTAIGELRRNGCEINCHFQGRTLQGSSVFRYVLISMTPELKKFALSLDPNFCNSASIKQINNSSNMVF
jgi:hypothetical protein